MRWIEAAVTFVGAAVALMAIVLAKRSVGVDTLGSVSERWVAEHRVD